jgi:hypothetical protein
VWLPCLFYLFLLILVHADTSALCLILPTFIINVVIIIIIIIIIISSSSITVTKLSENYAIT